MKLPPSKWRLHRCCFCSSLQFGCILIGIIVVITQIVAIISNMEHFEHIYERKIDNNDLRKKAFIRYMMFLVLSFVIFVFGLSVIVASLKKLAKLLKANAGILLVAAFIYTAISIINEPPPTERAVPDESTKFTRGVYLSTIIKLLVAVYFSLVMWSYGLHLEDESIKGYSSS